MADQQAPAGPAVGPSFDDIAALEALFPESIEPEPTQAGDAMIWEPSFTHEEATLTETDAGAGAQPGSGSNTPQLSQYDPRALLNPRSSSSSKRPASSGQDSDRGRADASIDGQFQLVERLHNVHERTASPAKRIKTTEEDKKKKKTLHSNGRGGGALQLDQSNGQTQASAPPIDLTMCKFSLWICLYSHAVC